MNPERDPEIADGDADSLDLEARGDRHGTELDTRRERLPELASPNRAGSIVSEFVSSIVEEAQAAAIGVIRAAAEQNDAGQRDALESADRMRARIDVMADELGSAADQLRRESERLAALHQQTTVAALTGRPALGSDTAERAAIAQVAAGLERDAEPEAQADEPLDEGPHEVEVVAHGDEEASHEEAAEELFDADTEAVDAVAEEEPYEDDDADPAGAAESAVDEEAPAEEPAAEPETAPEEASAAEAEPLAEDAPDADAEPLVTDAEPLPEEALAAEAEPLPEETLAQEPLAQEPVADEPLPEETLAAAQQPTLVDEPAAVEPAAIAEEAVEEPAAAEAAADEPAVEEPAADSAGAEPGMELERRQSEEEELTEDQERFARMSDAELALAYSDALRAMDDEPTASEQGQRLLRYAGSALGEALTRPSFADLGQGAPPPERVPRMGRRRRERAEAINALRRACTQAIEEMAADEAIGARQ